MKVGSLVAFIGQWNTTALDHMIRLNIKPPVKGEVYTVSDVSKGLFSDGYDVAIGLEEKGKSIAFRANLFVELQSPDDVDIQEIIYEAIKQPIYYDK